MALSNSTKCNASFALTQCPSTAAWAAAYSCTQGLGCRGTKGSNSMCSAVCYAQTTLCFVGANCAVGVGSSAIAYCQSFIGTVNDVNGVGDGLLGSCLANGALNYSTIENYKLCTSAVQLSGALAGLSESSSDTSTYQIVVTLLAVLLGVFLVVIVVLIVYITLCSGMTRRSARRVEDGGSGSSSHPPVSRSGEYRTRRSEAPPGDTPTLALDTAPASKPGKAAPPPPHPNGKDDAAVRRSSIAWVQHDSATSFSTQQSVLVNRLGIQEELARSIVRLLKLGKVQKGKLIGRGGSGAVHCCLLGNGAFIAHKEIYLPSLGKLEAQQLSQEMSIISTLNHRHCVRYYHAEINLEKKLASVWMEYVPGGALSSLAKSIPEPLAEPVAKSYIRQTLQGLAYLHSHGIVHRDVKADNVLVDSDGLVKLADFGSSKLLHNSRSNGGSTLSMPGGSVTDTMVGTPYWMAPEVVNLTADEEPQSDAGGGKGGKEGYNNRADIWSLGIMACEVLSQGEVPWPSFPTYWEVLMHISQKEPILPKHVSPLCQEFLRACLTRDPKKRPGARELLQHAWFDEKDEGLGGTPGTSFETIGDNQDFRSSFGFRECLRALGELQTSGDQDEGSGVTPTPGQPIVDHHPNEVSPQREEEPNGNETSSEGAPNDGSSDSGRDDDAKEYDEEGKAYEEGDDEGDTTPQERQHTEVPQVAAQQELHHNDSDDPTYTFNVNMSSTVLGVSGDIGTSSDLP